MVEGAVLTATFHVSSDQLQIQYSVRNNTETVFYIVDAAVIVGLQGDIKVETAHPSAEYVSASVVLLFDKLTQLPPGTRTTVPRSAYANRVDAGATHSRQVALPLPLRDRRLVKSAPATIRTCTRIKFEIGVIFPGGDLTAEEQVVAGTRLSRLNTAAYNQQQTLSIDSPLTPPISIETGE